MPVKKSQRKAVRKRPPGRRSAPAVPRTRARSTAVDAPDGELRVAGMRSAAVARATGRGWSEWFAILDRAGADRMSHKEIATYLHDRRAVPDWWSQMVTVGYEQARGRRAKHQKPDGYSVSASKTVAAPLDRLFAAWTEAGQRARWLADPAFTVRRATPGKSMRITWVDGRTHVDANFYARGAGRSQVAVEHSKLVSAAAAARMKAYWATALGKLAALY